MGVPSNTTVDVLPLEHHEVANDDSLNNTPLEEMADAEAPSAELQVVEMPAAAPASAATASSSAASTPASSSNNSEDEESFPESSMTPVAPSAEEQQQTQQQDNIVHNGKLINVAPVSVGGAKSESSSSSRAVEAGAALIPHPEKVAKNGEDAWFISEDRRVLVVADGVGGWAELNVDPALFSKGLCAGVGEHSRAVLDDDDGESVRAAVQRAYDDICDQGIEGSSTLCTAFCYPDHVIVCNLGDSGFRLVRGHEVVFHSEEQTHQFNFPYQLGSRGRGEAEHPSDALIDRVPILPGDVIIMGSDGLFDNVFDAQLVGLVQDNIGKSADEIAHVIAQTASGIASDPNAETPFARGAADNNLSWCGGKLDDITVVVAKL